jgi:hypothetical protein
VPNSIKYSVSAQTLALKKGNFWIGTGDVGKGPTSTTDYYNGITPPSGGYTIYLNKATQGPAIYTAGSDAALISLGGRIAGQTFETAGAALAWFATQNDKMVFNIDYPSIVTNGLVNLYDSGFRSSYPTINTSWYDLITNSTTTLINGPAFSSDSSGSIYFDGIDDIATTTITIEAPTNSNLQSLGVWLYGNSSNNSFTGTNAAEQGACHFIVNWQSSNQIRFAQTWYGGHPTESTDFATVTSLGWNYMVAIKKAVGIYDIYFNGSKVISDVTKVANISTQFRFGNWWSGMMVPMTGVATVQSYNRALSAAEVLQNYNAQKSRFGL